MKILVVCQYYHPEPFRISDICAALVKMGHQVTVVTGTPNYPEGEIYPGYEKGAHSREVLDGVTVIRCPLIPRKRDALHRLANYFSFPRSAGRMLKKLDEDFDVVFVNQLSPVMMASPGIAWAGRHGKKCVVYCLDLWPLSLCTGGIREGSALYRFFGWLSGRIYRKADCLAVSSYGFIPYFQETFGFSPETIRYIPQYAESLFDDVAAADPGKQGVDYVFAGNVGALQSVETIVRAARLLRDDDNIRIHIVGGGKSLEACQALGEGLPNLYFYGRRDVSEMPRFYAMADAMLMGLVNNRELNYNFPGKVQSYMAAGKAILGAVEGETARIVADAQCGECCKAEDPEALAELLRRYAGRKEELAAFGIRAREYYTGHFGKEQVMRQLEDLLQSNCAVE